jgi:hypothetical protein
MPLPDTSEMNMRLKRTVFTNSSTIGELYLPDGTFHSFTLEDVCRDFKISEQTAIPAGRYEVVMSWSNRFQQIMPLLLNVPFYEGIRIHSGNTPENTWGCILVGRKKGENAIYESRLAFEDLFPKIKKMTEKGKLFINIEGGFPADQWKA